VNQLKIVIGDPDSCFTNSVSLKIFVGSKNEK